ncbi:high frequency lysogenization protein HflD [Celerinatantimonas yamalensis]|uniref:High frequency lysogenization protein HflD homolog n=1 Tax=Celerinatantimonas yamalensis TaxID=559956 RepID=A0ABW9G3I8_9GAMM
MIHTLQEQVIAFAGVCQSARLVQIISRGQSIDSDALNASLGSILQTDPPTTEAVFGGIEPLQLGLTVMRQQLGYRNEQRDGEITRYLVGLMALARRLMKRADMQSMLAERLQQVKRQLNHFQIADEQIQASLAAIYSDIISPLGNRIQVAGDTRLLQQPAVQNQVRATLLCGIRSAILWQQVGGKRLQLIFQRSKLLTQIDQCLLMH